MKELWWRGDVVPLILTQSLAGDEELPSRLGRLPVAIELQRLSGLSEKRKISGNLQLTYLLHGAGSFFRG
jgi:hypothetical protein